MEFNIVLALVLQVSLAPHVYASFPRLCGQSLVDYTAIVCGERGYYGHSSPHKRSLTAKGLFREERDAKSFLGLSRERRRTGRIAHECCTNLCSWSTIESYCNAWPVESQQVPVNELTTITPLLVREDKSADQDQGDNARLSHDTFSGGNSRGSQDAASSEPGSAVETPLDRTTDSLGEVDVEEDEQISRNNERRESSSIITTQEENPTSGPIPRPSVVDDDATTSGSNRRDSGGGGKSSRRKSKGSREGRRSSGRRRHRRKRPKRSASAMVDVTEGNNSADDTFQKQVLEKAKADDSAKEVAVDDGVMANIADELLMFHPQNEVLVSSEAMDDKMNPILQRTPREQFRSSLVRIFNSKPNQPNERRRTLSPGKLQFMQTTNLR